MKVEKNGILIYIRVQTTSLWEMMSLCFLTWCTWRVEVFLQSQNACRTIKSLQWLNLFFVFILLLPRSKIKHIQDLVQENVKRMMAEQLHNHSTTSGHQKKTDSHCRFSKPGFIAASIIFGPKI